MELRNQSKLRFSHCNVDDWQVQELKSPVILSQNRNAYRTAWLRRINLYPSDSNRGISFFNTSKVIGFT